MLELGFGLGLDSGTGLGLGLVELGLKLMSELIALRMSGEGLAPLSDTTLDESPGAGAGAVGSLLPAVFGALLPLPELGLGSFAVVLPLLGNALPPPAAEVGPVAGMLPSAVLGAGALGELLLPVLPVGPDTELIGVSTAGARAGAIPGAPGLDEDKAGAVPDAPVVGADKDGAVAGPVGLPVAGVRGTTGALPGVVPGGVDGTDTLLCAATHA